MKLPTKCIINIHSFVDLITNSSSEIFVCASDKTITAVKSIINNVLLLGGSKITADDLFEFALEKDEESYGGDYEVIGMIVKPKDADSELGKVAAKLLSNLTGLFEIDSQYN
jgi:hypothetical protein